jgi:hypothetical protein
MEGAGAGAVARAVSEGAQRGLPCVTGAWRDDHDHGPIRDPHATALCHMSYIQGALAYCNFFFFYHGPATWAFCHILDLFWSPVPV